MDSLLEKDRAGERTPSPHRTSPYRSSDRPWWQSAPCTGSGNTARRSLPRLIAVVLIPPNFLPARGRPRKGPDLHLVETGMPLRSRSRCPTLMPAERISSPSSTPEAYSRKTYSMGRQVSDGTRRHQAHPRHERGHRSGALHCTGTTRSGNRPIGAYVDLVVRAPSNSTVGQFKGAPSC